MRVFRSGGLTKDAVYLRGLASSSPPGAGGDLDVLWLGKMPRRDPLVDGPAASAACSTTRVLPRYLDDPEAHGASPAAGRPTRPSSI